MVLSLTIMVLLSWSCMGRAALAEERNFFTLRRSLGLGLVGGSALLVKKGFDLRREANDLYRRYEISNDPVEADQLYRRTTNRDVKSQVSWALSAAFAVSGARMLLSEEKRTDSNERPVLAAAQDEGWRFDARLARPCMGFSVKKVWAFF